MGERFQVLREPLEGKNHTPLRLLQAFMITITPPVPRTSLNKIINEKDRQDAILRDNPEELGIRIFPRMDMEGGAAMATGAGGILDVFESNEGGLAYDLPRYLLYADENTDNIGNVLHIDSSGSVANDGKKVADIFRNLEKDWRGIRRVPFTISFNEESGVTDVIADCSLALTDDLYLYGIRFTPTTGGQINCGQVSFLCGPNTPIHPAT